MRLPNNSNIDIQIVLVALAMFLIYGATNKLLLGDFQLCFWRALSGFPCPGCGLTHAGLYFLRGNFKESFFWHPLFLPLIITLAAGCLPHNLCKIADQIKANRKWLTLLIAASLALFVARLILFYPQTPDAGPMYYDKNNYLHKAYSFVISTAKSFSTDLAAGGDCGSGSGTGTADRTCL